MQSLIRFYLRDSVLPEENSSLRNVLCIECDVCVFQPMEMSFYLLLAPMFKRYLGAYVNFIDRWTLS